jgi:hypothetical protein
LLWKLTLVFMGILHRFAAKPLAAADEVKIKPKGGWQKERTVPGKIVPMIKRAFPTGRDRAMIRP